MTKSRLLNGLVILALVAMLLPGQQVAQAQSPTAEAAADAPYVPGEVVVMFKPGKSQQAYAAQAQALAGRAGLQVARVGGRGSALLRADPEADVNALAASLQGQPEVLFAEPNYIYALPEPAASPEGNKLQTEFVLRPAPENPEFEGKDFIGIPISALQAMKTKSGSSIKATYPNDPYLWWNNGWDWIGASIVWPNTTASAGVCVIDTGVDYTHPDLIKSTALGPVPMVIKGYDFVNADTNPMDDNGHGTHVAGIIAAQTNNKEGIGGVSTGKVVAVKVLNAQGWGTSFDVAQGINYCANRADVRVLNMSLGGGNSGLMYNAVNYAVNTKGKLIAAAAGNSNSSTPIYPAGFAAYTEFADKVLAVAASGQWFEIDWDEDGEIDWWGLDLNCRANYSNYGAWVSVSAPGTAIYSTLPWDKPFYLNYYYGYATRYGSLSGTSMATPFVAASAARRWGYKPLRTNANIGADVKSISPWSTWDYEGDGACWPASMHGKKQVNVAALLDRGAMGGSAFDSSTGLPLVGAQIQAYQKVGAYTYLRGTGVITPFKWEPWPWQTDPKRIYMWFTEYTDIINLPTGSGYTQRVDKAGYTASPQLAYRHGFADKVYGGGWSWAGRTGVPPKSSNFDAVLGWWVYLYGEYINPNVWDLDLNVWLPDPQPGQPAEFIVGPQGDAFGFLEDDPTGTLIAFPFARWLRDGGSWDVRLEDTVIRSRPANPALPYYRGDYTIMVTDYGQTIDHDSDGGTPRIPLMGVYFVPHLYIWKDGVIKLFVNMGAEPVIPYDTCNARWWKAAVIRSGASGSPLYIPVNQCGDASIVPYVASGFSGQMETQK